jgi:hypothetical protein
VIELFVVLACLAFAIYTVVTTLCDIIESRRKP